MKLERLALDRTQVLIVDVSAVKANAEMNLELFWRPKSSRCESIGISKGFGLCGQS